MTYECDHTLIPVIYGYMTDQVVHQIDLNEVIYGGVKQYADSPDWFCLKCLDDVYL